MTGTPASLGAERLAFGTTAYATGCRHPTVQRGDVAMFHLPLWSQELIELTEQRASGRRQSPSGCNSRCWGLLMVLRVKRMTPVSPYSGSGGRCRNVSRPTLSARFGMHWQPAISRTAGKITSVDHRAGNTGRKPGTPDGDPRQNLVRHATARSLHQLAGLFR